MLSPRANVQHITIFPMRFLTFLTILCATSALRAQTLPEFDFPIPSTNFHDICKAADAHFAEHPDDADTDCWDNDRVKYQRWKWFWRDRVMPDGSFPDLRAQWTAQQKALAQQVQQREALPQWQSEGPNKVVDGGGYWGIGRTKHVAFHPQDPDIFYLGTPDGGIWKTSDGGGTWAALGDGLPYLPVSVVLIDPEHPDTLYISLGDKGGWWHWNLGVYKSMDGGATWSPTGLDWALASENVVYNMIMSPSDPQTIFIASNKGIRRTQDGGTSWQTMLNGEFTDIHYRPGDDSTLYAAKHDYWGVSQVIRSTDGGQTWVQVSDFQESNNEITLSVTPLNPDWLGVRCSAGKSFYLSKNQGANLAYKSIMPEDAHFQLSPSDSNVVYTSGVVVHRSEDQGETWTQITNWWNNGVQTEVHADVHDIVLSPHNPEEVYFCNDGGLYRYHEPTELWTDLSDGLGIAQFYRVAVSASGPVKIAAGSQDNGGWLRNTNGNWKHTNGGDAMCQAIDPTNSNTLYTEYYGGLSIYRSTNNFASSVDIADNIPGGLQGDWVTPFLLNPRNPKTFLVAFHDIYRSFDQGDHFEAISDNLTGSTLKTFRELVMSAGDTNFIVAARANRIYKTTDGGQNWTNSPVGNVNEDITRLALHRQADGSHLMWATKSGYAAGRKVYRSANSGANWQNISYDLPNVPMNCILYDSVSQYVFVGTDIGVFYKAEGDTHWALYGQGLPAVYVFDLVLRPSTHRIYAATHGRGIYSVDIEAIVDNNEPVAAPTSWTAYPNPLSSGKLFFKNAESAVFSGQVVVWDALGRSLVRREFEAQTASDMMLDVSSLPTGAYMVQGVDRSGKSVFSLKVLR
jgi:photosystem II stability/assembly factor-like uncharacterized protein